MTEFICMNRLNPFGTGKVFKLNDFFLYFASGCLNPFGTGKVFKPDKLLSAL